MKWPKQRYDLVWVMWDDATAVDGWSDGSDEPRFCFVTSVGFLVKQTKTHIVLAQDLDPEGHACGRGQIPTGIIHQMKVLKKKQ